MSVLTAKGLVDYVRYCLDLPTIYVWGGMGDMVTMSLIRRKKTEYPSIYTKTYRRRYWKCYGRQVRGFDCSGLIKNYLMGGLGDYRMQPELDMNSEMMLKRAERLGTIDILPEIPGVCLYMHGHVGIYIGEQQVIECTSSPRFGDGVICTKVSDRDWTHWFYCPTVVYEV